MLQELRKNSPGEKSYGRFEVEKSEQLLCMFWTNYFELLGPISGAQSTRISSTFPESPTSTPAKRFTPTEFLLNSCFKRRAGISAFDWYKFQKKIRPECKEILCPSRTLPFLRVHLHGFTYTTGGRGGPYIQPFVSHLYLMVK